MSFFSKVRFFLVSVGIAISLSSLAYANDPFVGVIEYVDMQKRILSISDSEYAFNQFTLVHRYDESEEVRLPMSFLTPNMWIAVFYEYSAGFDNFIARKIVILPNGIVASELKQSFEED